MRPQICAMLRARSGGLGPNSDSSGCVSIKNYDAFLHPFLKHVIKQLAALTRLE